MKKALVIGSLSMMISLAAVFILSQQTKQITLAWDTIPTGQVWTEVRVYDISSTPELLMGKVNCQAGPPITCPTQLTFTIQRKAYSFAARSWDGNWESDNSNIVILPGPPTPPGNLKR